MKSTINVIGKIIKFIFCLCLCLTMIGGSSRSLETSQIRENLNNLGYTYPKEKEMLFKVTNICSMIYGEMRPKNKNFGMYKNCVFWESVKYCILFNLIELFFRSGAFKKSSGKFKKSVWCILKDRTCMEKSTDSYYYRWVVPKVSAYPIPEDQVLCAKALEISSYYVNFINGLC